jgi:hypothetical protein
MQLSDEAQPLSPSSFAIEIHFNPTVPLSVPVSRMTLMAWPWMSRETLQRPNPMSSRK